jgi:hypothetical protein
LLAEVSQPLGFATLSPPQPPNLSHSPQQQQQQMNILSQGFQQAHMMFPPQAPQATFCAQPFASTSQQQQQQAAFVQQQQFQFLQQQQQPMNNMGAPAATASITDLDTQHMFEDQNISENLSGQLRMCGINSNDPGEMLSMENMSTDSMFKKYLG